MLSFKLTNKTLTVTNDETGESCRFSLTNLEKKQNYDVKPIFYHRLEHGVLAKWGRKKFKDMYHEEVAPAEYKKWERWRKNLIRVCGENLWDLYLKVGEELG
jgi:hypothetical protein